MISHRVKIHEIIIHCSATPNDRDVTLSMLRDWHIRDNGWDDIGYHYFIDRNANIHECRDKKYIGAHCRGHNDGSIGVCLAGGIDHHGKPQFNYTIAQMASLKELCESLIDEYGPLKVKGHNSYDRTKACPAFHVESWWSCMDYFGV